MPNYPQSAAGLNYITYPPGPIPLGPTLTSGGANTKGTYVELAASSAFACNHFAAYVQATIATAGVQILLDIATGAGGAETVIVPDLLTEGTNTASNISGAGGWQLPLAIDASTRIAGRIAASSAATPTLVVIMLAAAGDTPGVSSFTALGINTADSGGTSVDPGAVANTKGAYAELSASLAAVAQVIVPLFSLGGNAAPAAARWYVDIAIGAAASEVVLIPDLPVTVSAGTTPRPHLTPRGYTFLTYIAAATRVAARASCQSTDATDRLIDVAALVATAPAETPQAIHVESHCPIQMNPTRVVGY
jgi:hypothetical protein